MKKIKAWAIFYRWFPKGTLQLIGYSHYQIFRTRYKAKQVCKEKEYVPIDKRKEMHGGWEIHPVIISFPEHKKLTNKKNHD